VIRPDDPGMAKTPRSLDDLPLAAYGGTGMDEPEPAPAEADPAMAADSAEPDAGAAVGSRFVRADAPGEDPPAAQAGAAQAESPIARVVKLFRTSRVAAGAGFAVVIVVGLLLLSGGGASPGATAATPTQGPTPGATIALPSGEVSLTLTGPVAGTFALTGRAGGQHVDASTVDLGWVDAQQTTLTITGPVDRGTRTTDERLVLTISILVDGLPVAFTSDGGECTVGMASVAGKVQGSFSCRKLKSADGKLTIEASGTYRS
jgi:hypothetical protein